MKIIDLRSDTVTLPTEKMRQAMYEAELGDDCYGEDPTVNQLEELAARMLGKEAALFTASGTMSNLVSILTHTHPGDEILLGSDAHMLWYEVGGAAALGGVVMRTLPNDPDGRIDPDAVRKAVRGENIHFPPTTLLCLENTQNRCGGAVLTTEYSAAIAELAHQLGLRVHLDGARVFNAAVALEVPVIELVKSLDSVNFCLSKALSAPVGSLLCGTEDFVDKARKWRKMLGGGMRQVGVIAAAGIVALKTMINRLAEDHANAQHLAHGLASIAGITINLEQVKTNMVMFQPPPTISSLEFIKRMNDCSLKFSAAYIPKVRAVTHRMVSATDIDEVLSRVEALIKELR